MKQQAPFLLLKLFWGKRSIRAKKYKLFFFPKINFFFWTISPFKQCMGVGIYCVVYCYQDKFLFIITLINFFNDLEYVFKD